MILFGIRTGMVWDGTLGVGVGITGVGITAGTVAWDGTPGDGVGTITTTPTGRVITMDFMQTILDLVETEFIPIQEPLEAEAEYIAVVEQIM